MTPVADPSGNQPGSRAYAAPCTSAWLSCVLLIFWGVINSMYIGNLLLLILSIPLVGIFVRSFHMPPAILAPITALITVLGVYTDQQLHLRHLLDDDHRHRRIPDEEEAGFEHGPMVLAFVLGSIIEASTRRSLLIFDGDPTGFFTRPISGTVLAIFVLLLLMPGIQALIRGRKSRTAAKSPDASKEVGDEARQPLEPK